MRFSLLKNENTVFESEKLSEVCTKFNLMLNQIVPPDSLKMMAGQTVLATVRPGTMSYDNSVFQPDVGHWFKIVPTEEQKAAYYRCQEAIQIYANRCMKLLPKPNILSGDLKYWLETARQVLEKELPIGNPYSTKAASSLSVYHLYSKPPEQRDLVKILTQLRLAMLYCHISLFSSAGPDIVYYLKPAR